MFTKRQIKILSLFTIADLENETTARSIAEAMDNYNIVNNVSYTIA
jgi:hypothetical protein